MEAFYHAAQEPIPTKLCATCNVSKPLSEFHKMKMTPDGFRPSCKSCRKERDKQPKVIVQQPLFVFEKTCAKCKFKKPIEQFNRMSSMKDGYHVHCRQCQSEYNRNARKENPDAYRIRDHIKHASDRCKARKKKRHQERTLTDPGYLERIKQQRRKHYLKYPEQAKDFYPRRRARILKATIGKVDYKYILKRDGYICHICQMPIDINAKKKSSTSLSFDHVIPLNPRPGNPQGDHSNENLKPSHHACNVRKGNRPLSELTSFDRRGPNTV